MATAQNEPLRARSPPSNGRPRSASFGPAASAWIGCGAPPGWRWRKGRPSRTPRGRPAPTAVPSSPTMFGRAAPAPAPPVHSGRHGQAADAVSPGDGGGARQRGHQNLPMWCSALAPWRTDGGPGGVATVDDAETERSAAAQWTTWLGHTPHVPPPPLRRILMWDNLAGHTSLVGGPLVVSAGNDASYTPLSGS